MKPVPERRLPRSNSASSTERTTAIFRSGIIRLASRRLPSPLTLPISRVGASQPENRIVKSNCRSGPNTGPSARRSGGIDGVAGNGRSPFISSWSTRKISPTKGASRRDDPGGSLRVFRGIGIVSVVEKCWGSLETPTVPTNLASFKKARIRPSYSSSAVGGAPSFASRSRISTVCSGCDAVAHEVVSSVSAVRTDRRFNPCGSRASRPAARPVPRAARPVRKSGS